MSNEQQDENAEASVSLIGQALKHANRRQFLCKRAPICPKCETKQIQLINHFVKPAEWKCRYCRTKFIFEPLLQHNSKQNKIQIKFELDSLSKQTLENLSPDSIKKYVDMDVKIIQRHKLSIKN